MSLFDFKLMQYALDSDKRVNVQVDGAFTGKTSPYIWYNVQSNRFEFFQNILWPSIIKCIIDITKIIRTQNICYSDEGVFKPENPENGR